MKTNYNHSSFSLFKSTFGLLVLIFIACSCQQQQQVSNDASITSESHATLSSKKDIAYGAADIVTSSLLDSEGNLWFGTLTEGLLKYDGQKFTQYTTADGLHNAEIWALLQDSNGMIWIGTLDGLSKYDGTTFTHVELPWNGENNLWGKNCNQGVVMSLLEDTSGNLWIGTCGDGVYKYDGKHFEQHLNDYGALQADSLHHNLIKSMVQSRTEEMWFTSLTHGAVSCLRDGVFEHYGPEQGLVDDMVFCSEETANGELWFGCIQTEQGGLYQFKNGRFNRFNKEDGLLDNFIFGLHGDQNNLLWIATGKGLCTYDGAQFNVPFPELEGRMNDIRTFVEDQEGNLWFGGRHGELWKFDGTEVHDYSRLKTL